jgi:hypothetical protein
MVQLRGCLKKYQSNGFKDITWKNLNGRLDKCKNANLSDSIAGNIISVEGENTAVVSVLSDPSSKIVTEANAEANESIRSVRRGGQKKGMTQAAKTALSKKRIDKALCNFVQWGEGEGK